MFNDSRITLKKQNLIMAYRTYGDPKDTPLIILHGFPESSENWIDFAEKFSKLGHYVICPDQRGFGKTSDNSSIKKYSLESLALDIIEFLELLNIRKIHLLGHDWGGVLGWYLCTKYSSHFLSFTCLNAPHWQIMEKEVRTSLKQIMRSWYIFFIQIPYFPERYFMMTDFKMIKALLIKSLYPLNKEDEYKFELLWRENIHSMLNWYRAIPFTKNNLVAVQLEVKTRLLWGAQDPFFNPSLAQKSLEYCAHAKLSILANSGHWPHQENQASVFKSLVDNLSD